MPNNQPIKKGGTANLEALAHGLCNGFVLSHVDRLRRHSPGVQSAVQHRVRNAELIGITAIAILGAVTAFSLRRLPTGEMNGTATAAVVMAAACCMRAGTLRPVLSARGSMSEARNIIVMPRLTPEQIRRAALRLDARKYPEHAKVLARAEAELKVLRRAA